MKKALSLILVVLMVTALFGCTQKTDTPPATNVVTLTGTGEGFGGEVTVTVTKDGDKITEVKAVGDKETPGIGDKAINELPAKIVEANSADVDVIAGATITSKAIIYAVKNALDPAANPWPIQKEETPVVEAPKGEAGPIVKVGLGQNISIAKSKSATAEATAAAQADVTIAAVGFDADGKVASVTVDVAQNKVAFDKDLKVTTDRAAELKSKKDLGPDYGMVKASSIGKEWYEQMAAFENWMIGKTVEEITGLKVKERDANHKNVPDVPELTSTVTITVEGYQAVVKEAIANVK